MPVPSTPTASTLLLPFAITEPTALVAVRPVTETIAPAATVTEPTCPVETGKAGLSPHEPLLQGSKPQPVIGTTTAAITITRYG